MTRDGYRTCGRQRGFSLVAAIFVLVILAMIGGFMVTIGTVERTEVSQALQAARANEAARAGVEWVIARALNAATRAATCGGPPPPNPTVLVTTGPFALTGPGLEGFSVSVTCNYSRHQETSTCFNVYHVTSTATSGAFGDAHYVSRNLQTRITDPAGACP